MSAFENLSLLRAFAGIVESGSISAAARRLRIPQPTLSRHLRTLEESSGGLLLRRDTHRMSLTETGHRLLADARVMLALAEDAQQRLHQDQTALRGHLRLFATIDAGPLIVTQIIAGFLQINPGVTAELNYSNRPLNMIQEGSDVAFLAGRIMDESVIARLAVSVERHLVASAALVKSRPRAKEPDDLKPWPWIALSGAQFGGPRQVTLYGPKRAEQMLEISPVFISEGALSLIEALRAGLGVCIMPDWMIRDDLFSGRLVRVLPQWHAKELPFYVAYPVQRILPARVRAFIDFAVKHITARFGTQPNPPGILRRGKPR